MWQSTLLVQAQVFGSHRSVHIVEGPFMIDGNSQQETGIVLQWFEEQDGELTLMPLPPNSPYVNPIEHI